MKTRLCSECCFPLDKDADPKCVLCETCEENQEEEEEEDQTGTCRSCGTVGDGPLCEECFEARMAQGCI